MAPYPIPYEGDLSEPTVRLSSQTMARLITAVSTHLMSVTAAADGVEAHLALNWYNMDLATLGRIHEAAPQLAYIQRDVHGLRHLLSVFLQDDVYTRASKEAISAALLAALPTSVEVFKAYNPERTATSVMHDDF